MFNSWDPDEDSTDPGRLETAAPMGFITPSLTLSHRDPRNVSDVSVHGCAVQHPCVPVFEARRDLLFLNVSLTQVV